MQKEADPEDFLSDFGANERAVLERVPTGPLRRFAASLVRTKMKLQFTGWLQYLVPGVPLALLAAFLGMGSLCLGAPRVASGFGALVVGITCILVFDLVTVKLRIRLPEGRPPRNDHLDLFDLMRVRRSCRSFQTRPLSDEDREALLASVRRHASNPTLGSSPIRLQYVHGPLSVWPTVNGTEFLIAIVPLPYDRLSVIDVGRTLQKVVMDATRAGLGTCWIGPGADHDSVRQLLGDRFDPEQEQIICTCAVGYRSVYSPLFVRIFNRLINHRLPFQSLFFSDFAMKVPADTAAAPLARFGRTFEACQWSPSSYNGQTTRAVISLGPDGEVAAVDFGAVTASRYYAPVALGIWCANWELGCDARGLPGRLDARPPAENPTIPRWDVTWTPA